MNKPTLINDLIEQIRLREIYDVEFENVQQTVYNSNLFKMLQDLDFELVNGDQLMADLHATIHMKDGEHAERWLKQAYQFRLTETLKHLLTVQQLIVEELEASKDKAEVKYD